MIADPTRRAELAKIHIFAKELALHEDSYRAILARFTDGRSESAKDMTPAERAAVLAHFSRLGAGKKRRTGAAGGAGAGTIERPFKKARKPQARLVWALWTELKNRGALDNPSREACRAFCARMAGIEAATDPDLMDAADLTKVIEALKAWIERVKTA